MFIRRSIKFKNFDFILFFTTILLLGIGLLSIYSSTKTKVFSQNDFYKQLIFLPPAFLAFFLATIFDYTKFKYLSKYIYAFNILLLLIVMFVGSSAYGAQRWIGIGGIGIQPSEIAKISLILILANYISQNKIRKITNLIPILIYFFIPAILIFKQPDLGTTLCLLAITMGMIFISDFSIVNFTALITPLFSAILILISKLLWIIYLSILLILIAHFYLQKKNLANKLTFKLEDFKYIILFVSNIVSGVLIPLSWDLLKEYQKNRIKVFLNPELDPLGAGYHVSQSQIAIGSGGLYGKGLFNGTQTQLNFIPFQHTDFIFCTISEELGFIGSIFILFLFLIIIFRTLYIASLSKDFFGRNIAVGIAIMFIFHIFVNIGMVTGILPAKGLPLPLMSYGGTFLVITMFCIGILESIALRREKSIFY
ncbi:MAG: rod shape-determining protein RodA [Candidatus Sericytochromatia bacterium]|nr:MAG: rod shape-determining protein RodA [Candidatus Sericytochromatia bacterium]